jgi:hypothetical protein
MMNVVMSLRLEQNFAKLGESKALLIDIRELPNAPKLKSLYARRDLHPARDPVV